jgi:hypothetical protein
MARLNSGMLPRCVCVLLCAGYGELRHGTEGWKCLETSLRALQQLLGGLPAAAVAAAADEEVLQLTFRCVLGAGVNCCSSCSQWTLAKSAAS